MTDEYQPPGRKKRKIHHAPPVEPAPVFNFDVDNPFFDPIRGEGDSLDFLDLALGAIRCDSVLRSVTVTVISVEFTSEHRNPAGQKLLQPSPAQVTYTFRNDAPQVEVRGSTVPSDYGDPTANFEQPTWINDPLSGHNWTCPVSHTKQRQITLTVTIRVHVPHDCNVNPTVTRIRGVPVAGANGLSFDAPLNAGLVPGDYDIPIRGLVSTNTLDNEVKIVDESIDWTVTVSGGEVTKDCAAGRSGVHRLYLTFGVPGGQVDYTIRNGFDLNANPQHITEARLGWAVEAVVAEHANVPGYDPDNEKHQVDAVFLRLVALEVRYCLGFRFGDTVNNTFMEDRANGDAPELHHYLWMCNANQAKGECHNIAAAFVLACRIIGVTGAFELGFIEPWPSRTDDPDNGFPKRSVDLPPSLVLDKSRPLDPVAPVKGYSPWIKGKFSVDHTGLYVRGTDRRAYNGAGRYQYCAHVDERGNINNFEGVARYQNQYLYAIGEVILDSETNSDLNASVYYTHHNRNERSRKVTFVHANGEFPLVFIASDTVAVDPTPYQQTGGSDAIAYEDKVNVGKTFRWES